MNEPAATVSAQRSVAPTEPTFRRGLAEDARALAKLQDVANEGELSCGRWATNRKDWIEVGAREIASGDTEMSFANTVVVELHGHVIGMLNFVRSEPSTDGPDGDPVARPFLQLRQQLGSCIYLRAMAIDADMRGQGFASRLLDLAEAVSAREALPLGVIVHETNVSLIQTYAARGYREIAREPVLEHASYAQGSMLLALQRNAV